MTTVMTKCDDFITKCEVYYKMCWYNSDGSCFCDGYMSNV